VSGILDVETVKNYLTDSRNRLSNDVISMMKSYIIAAMPSYKDNELDGLTIKQMIEKVVLSEQILSVQQAVMGIQSDGVKVQIMSAAEYEAMQEPQQEKSKKKLNITAEEALQQIKKVEKETVNPRDIPMFQRDTKKTPKPTIKTEDLDPELLVKMMGQAEANDPIAAKLFGKG
jgi:predicted YcjX-like family ATPase